MLRNQMIPVVIPSRAKLPLCSCCGFNLNFAYLKSYAGLLKILQLIIAGLCKSLLMNFGLKYASLIGFSYDAFLTTISGSVITTTVLLLTYIWSENSMRLVRSSLLEVFFNGSTCLNFIGSCSWLLLTIHTFLYPDFLAIPFFFIYPIMVAVNILGFLLSLIYGIDCYLAYKYYKGYR
ncbi:protein singles bar [Planococcus citri]|uniref:protein singles bar n=1 Tax=Planococcus citri TaxID=170843 RepID=UPI0031F83AF6